MAGCGAAVLRPELGARETTELLTRLERGISGVRSTPVGGLAAARPWQLRPDAAESLLRLGMEAAIVTDVARSIPSDRRVPTELGQVLASHVPILDECVSSYHHLLRTAPAITRRNVDQRLRAEPDLVGQAVAWIESQADTIGISDDSRVRLRSAANEVGARIRRQSTNAVIDDCVLKVDTMVARSGSTLLDVRTTRTGAMIDAIWQAVEGTGSAGLATPTPPPSYGGTTASGVVTVTSPPMILPDEPMVPEPPPSTESPGDSELIIGGILMGSGVVVFGLGTLIGWAITGNALLPMLIAATPGSILLIIGLILVIVGAVQNSHG